MVHGSGSAIREGAVPFEPMIEIFLRNGYAVFSWDKPGSGKSKGQFDGNRQLSQRADILLDGINSLSEIPDINPTEIGLWGISQAGWIMPLVLEKSDIVDFIIVVSGGGEDSIEQMAYQVGQRVLCEGGSIEQAVTIEEYWPKFAKAIEYSAYREAAEILLSTPGVSDYTGLKLVEEEDWKPRSRNNDAFIDPMNIIEHVRIPVLAFFGELDKNIDPVQGAEAYEEALLKAGNRDYQVITIAGVNHVMMSAKTGCISEEDGREFIPEYLVTLETWLQHLPR
jgi:pimeloyl-ACP methyl ester carboxylesterase